MKKIVVKFKQKGPILIGRKFFIFREEADAFFLANQNDYKLKFEHDYNGFRISIYEKETTPEVRLAA